MASIEPEPIPTKAMKQWLIEHGGNFHENAVATEVPSGAAFIATQCIAADSTVVACPFSLAITEELSQNCVSKLIDCKDVIKTGRWTDRQWLCTYLSFHWIFEDTSVLQHYAYVKTLPSPDKLRTPLYFSPVELKAFEGTNLYGATLDRERDLKAEWNDCYTLISASNASWGAGFTWERYLAAATYVSSRAFPSSVLSTMPSLVPDETTKLVLLPGVDSLNHRRAQPVSWIVNNPEDYSGPTLSIVSHSPVAAGQEILNNYGPKPNSTFILGYGFSIPDNPDDTIILKLGGMSGKKWEVGRAAAGADGLWDEILQSFTQGPDEPASYEDMLDASGALAEMVQALIERLPAQKDLEHGEMRPEVVTMLCDYVEGQRQILESLLEFTQSKEAEAVEKAKEEGMEIVVED